MATSFIFSIIVLIFSAILHELAHGVAADLQGDPTPRLQGRLTLNPFKHLDPIGSFLLPVLTYNIGGFIFGWARPVEFNPYNLRNQRWGEAIIAIAGPATNVLIAIVFGLLVRFGESIGLSEAIIGLSSIIVIVNLSLAVFNMIPIPPLDGSKVLFSLFPDRFYHFRESIERYSLIVFLLCIFLGGELIYFMVRTLFYLITGFGL